MFFKVIVPYILWVTVFNTSFLLFYLAFDMWIFSFGDSGGGEERLQNITEKPMRRLLSLNKFSSETLLHC